MIGVTLQKQSSVELLQQIAEEQKISAEELLESIIQNFLDQWINQKIRSEIRAYTQLQPQLVPQYLGQYVAIHNSTLIDHDQHSRALHLRTRSKYGRIPILLRQVTEEK